MSEFETYSDLFEDVLSTPAWMDMTADDTTTNPLNSFLSLDDFHMMKYIINDQQPPRYSTASPPPVLDKLCAPPVQPQRCVAPMNTIRHQTTYFSSAPYHIIPVVVLYQDQTSMWQNKVEDWAWTKLSRSYVATRARLHDVFAEAASAGPSSLSPPLPNLPTPPPEPSKQKIKGTEWSEAEKVACITLMKEVCQDPHYAHKEQRYTEVGRLMKDLYGFDRPRVKNEWCRHLRARSGFEDRSVRKRTMGLVTSALAPHRRGEKRKREEEEEEEERVSKRMREAVEEVEDEELGEGVVETEGQKGSDEEVARQLQVEENRNRRRESRR